MTSGCIARRTGAALVGLNSRSSWTAAAAARNGDAPFASAGATPRGCRYSTQIVESDGKKAFLVDTVPMVRNLEEAGLPSKQAGAIISAINEVLNDGLENFTQLFVTKEELQKSAEMLEANLSEFKAEVRTSQEHHFSLLQREAEKIRDDIEKMRTELKYEIDKATAGQRLDLNLERGRIRDELAKQNAETTELTTKLDREIRAYRDHLDAVKHNVKLYCQCILGTLSATALFVIYVRKS